ncbi:hypothetical protein M446_2040 [Methylobacterium sp. 4-46]|uniref:hypothetical protein n=1 Tax=unclassified Methylobacterium TaxID=2615210 RepID=UPI000165C6E6|nr:MULTISPECIES: hypothetical protein [Methylobacterium]ACA16504.1 hypothetical protein M446_2040 [Methylobacterium sp. 4-46]WFT82213.1 hypothetical protein QA634_10340 [Methylobacterium nodulans]
MSTVITDLVAEAIREVDAQFVIPYGIEPRDAQALARAAIAAYGDALASAGLAIVPLAAAETLRAQDARSHEARAQTREGRQVAGRAILNARLRPYRSLVSRRG